MMNLSIKEVTPEEEAAKKEKLRKENEERQREQTEKHIASLKEEAAKKSTEHDHVLRLRQEFPDLIYHRDRWDNVRYKSASVNSQCDKFEWRRTCGCCSDPGILAMPYIETALGKVYSDPFYMEVGEGRSYGHVWEHHGWQDRYRKVGIPEDLIGRIKNLLDSEIARSQEDEDDD